MIMNEKKIHKVQIFEENYTLMSDDTESFVLKVAELVDMTMKEISRQTMITDSKKIAVLSALRIADQLLNCERNYTHDQQRRIALEHYIDQELSMLSLQ